MDESPATRRSLIVKLRDPADTAAWHEFVANYGPLVYGLARRKGLQDADANDLCQEVFRAVAGADRPLGPSPRQLPRLAVTNRPELADQLPHAAAAPTPREWDHQRARPPRSPASRRPVGHGPVRGRVPRSTCSCGQQQRSGASSCQRPGKPSGRPRSRDDPHKKSRPSSVYRSGPSMSLGAGSWLD